MTASATKNGRTLGQRGEAIAQAYLRRLGYQIEAVNWRAGRLGEIDLIVRCPADVMRVFVEVKTRKGAACGHPAEAVDVGKQEKLRLLAECYLAQCSNEVAMPVRFDVLSIHFPGNARPADIDHLENAF